MSEEMQHCVCTIISTAAEIHNSLAVAIDTTMDHKSPPVTS